MYLIVQFGQYVARMVVIGQMVLATFAAVSLAEPKLYITYHTSKLTHWAYRRWLLSIAPKRGLLPPATRQLF